VQSPTAPFAPPQAPLRYTPRYLAEKILISKAALERERKQVTVLFADLEGSMELLADAIMALGGAPLAHEDHAVWACYAALAVQASVKQYAAEVQRSKGVPSQIRVGVNVGADCRGCRSPPPASWMPLGGSVCWLSAKGTYPGRSPYSNGPYASVWTQTSQSGTLR
jgi:class 3 adenylate cyclase